jgi:pyrimidine and pyridine-specific 5'-nucleotidase
MLDLLHRLDEKVDGSLPIEEILKPDPELCSMLEQLKTRKWAFTNAGLDVSMLVLCIMHMIDRVMHHPNE